MQKLVEASMVGYLVWEKGRVAFFLRRGNVGSTVDFQTKREVLLQMVPRYREASISQKGDESQLLFASNGD
jgi:hypothetical protein